MSKRVFVVDDPTVAAEVEALLRSKGLNRTSQRNADLPSMNEAPQRGVPRNEEFPFYKRMTNATKTNVPSPFPWRDGGMVPHMKRPSIDEHIREAFGRAMRTPSRAPFESSCGTFNPDPHHTSRLFVNGGCGGFIPADAHDLAMGRQLYTHSGCGGFEPVPQHPIGDCGGWSTPSIGGCGGTMHSIGGCGGWSAPSYGGCGGTTYRSGC